MRSDLFLQNVIGLVAAVYTERAAELRLDRQDPRQALLQEICAHIAANLWDPELDPRQIAQAYYISVRHLHSLFSQQETTVSEWIRQRRLEECRNDLSSPAFAAELVATIAVGHGFLDAAHFSRLLRATFKETPSGFRPYGPGRSPRRGQQPGEQPRGWRAVPARILKTEASGSSPGWISIP